MIVLKLVRLSMHLTIESKSQPNNLFCFDLLSQSLTIISAIFAIIQLHLIPINLSILKKMIRHLVFQVIIQSLQIL